MSTASMPTARMPQDEIRQRIAELGEWFQNLNLGGEQSGHMIFGDYSTTGDGLVAALQILKIMKTKGQPLSKLGKSWSRFPQLVRNVRVKEKKPFEDLDGVPELLRQAEAAVRADGGRLLLRYSGTEPKARLLMEGRNSALLEQWSKKICDALQRHVGAEGNGS